MNLSIIDIDVLGDLIEEIINKREFLKEYSLSKKTIQNISNPNKVVEYILEFSNKKLFFYIKVQNFFSHQVFKFWIVNNEHKKLNISDYFTLTKIPINIKQKSQFKSKNRIDILYNVSYILSLYLDNFDANLILIFQGKYRYDVPFDWGEYK